MKFNKKEAKDTLKLNALSVGIYTSPDVDNKILEAWVSGLRKYSNRTFVYKNLLGAIAKHLSYPKAFSIESLPQELVESMFKTFIEDYSAGTVLNAMDEILMWYAMEEPDVVMTSHVRNFINNALLARQERLTFREKLSAKAESYYSNLDIKADIETIKAKMNDAFKVRRFTIELIHPKTSCLAVGSSGDSRYQTFIPNYVNPLIYQGLFIDALKDLGFRKEDMTLNVTKTNDFDSYNICLVW